MPYLIRLFTSLKNTGFLRWTWLLLLPGFLYFPTVNAQGAKKDSLEQVLNQPDLSTGDRVLTLGRLASHYYFNDDKTQGDRLLDEALKLAETLEDKQYLARTLAIQAMQLRIAGEPAASEEAIQSALSTLEDTMNPSVKGYVWYARGWLETRNDQPTEAIESYIEALEFYNESSDPSDDAIKSSIYLGL